MNRRMPNGTYGGLRGERKSPLLDQKNSGFFHIELLYIVERDETFDSVLRSGQREIAVFDKSLRKLKIIVHIFGFQQLLYYRGEKKIIMKNL